jgi:hypothetical protein
MILELRIIQMPLSLWMVKANLNADNSPRSLILFSS